MGEVHAHDPVARLEHAEVGGHVGLGPGVGLDVDVLGAREQGEGPLLGEPLGDVDVLAAAVVALARQAFGVLVGQPAALGLHDRGRDVVLARDELDLVVLAAALPLHRLPEHGVDAPRSTPSRRPWPGRWSWLADSFLPVPWFGRHAVGYLPTNRSGFDRRAPRPLSASAGARSWRMPAASRTSASRASGIAPGRRMPGRSPEQSTTVEAGPPRAGRRRG